MPTHSASLSREDLVAKIREVAAEIATERLGRKLFLARSGLSGYTVDRYFDRWADAVREAGLAPGATEPPPAKRLESDAMIIELQRVASLVGGGRLTRDAFEQFGQISASAVARRFGSWSRALDTAGLIAAESPEPATEEELIIELRRIAGELQNGWLTRNDFKRLSAIDPHRVERTFGGWHKALTRAGLEISPAFKKEVPLTALAAEFLRVSIELGRVPTLLELTRRSRHASDTFSKKHGGYVAFKGAAISLLLSSGERIPPAIRAAFSAEHERSSTSAARAPLDVPAVDSATMRQVGLLVTLQKTLRDWTPSAQENEPAYSDALASYLRARLPEDARVEREYRHEGTTVDLHIAFDSTEVYVEVKLQLQRKSDYDRLVGQIVQLRPERNTVMIVLIGDTNVQFLGRLRAYCRQYHREENPVIQLLSRSDA